MLLKHKTQEIYAKALYFPEDRMVAKFTSWEDKRLALMESDIFNSVPLSYILKDWDILPPSWDHLTAGDRVKRDYDTYLVQSVHGIGDLAFVQLVREGRRIAVAPFTIFELKEKSYTLLPYDFIKPETVEVSGKTYRKADVEKALEGVKAVGK